MIRSASPTTIGATGKRLLAPQVCEVDRGFAFAILRVVSEQNLEWVRDSYTERDQLAAFAGRAAPGVEVDLSAAYPDRPILMSRQEVRGFCDCSWGASQRFERERYFDVDDERVLVLVRASATGETSGAQVDARPAHVFTFRDGLLVRFEVYLDRSEALDALGLRG